MFISFLCLEKKFNSPDCFFWGWGEFQLCEVIEFTQVYTPEKLINFNLIQIIYIFKTKELHLTYVLACADFTVSPSDK